MVGRGLGDAFLEERVVRGVTLDGLAVSVCRRRRYPTPDAHGLRAGARVGTGVSAGLPAFRTSACARDRTAVGRLGARGGAGCGPCGNPRASRNVENG